MISRYLTELAWSMALWSFEVGMNCRAATRACTNCSCVLKLYPTICMVSLMTARSLAAQKLRCCGYPVTGWYDKISVAKDTGAVGWLAPGIMTPTYSATISKTVGPDNIKFLWSIRESRINVVLHTASVL